LRLADGAVCDEAEAWCFAFALGDRRRSGESIG
jgi:hypothetical protein